MFLTAVCLLFLIELIALGSQPKTALSLNYKFFKFKHKNRHDNVLFIGISLINKTLIICRVNSELNI